MLRQVFIIMFLIITSSIWADGPDIQTQIESRSIYLGEQTVFSIDSTSQLDNVNPPKVPGIQIQFAGTTQSFQQSLINGKVSSRKSIIYQFVIIPQKKGKFHIGPFELIIQGKSVKTQEFDITVSSAPQNSQTQADPNDPFAAIEQLLNRQQSQARPKELFFKLQVKNHEVFQNQQVIVEGKLYASEPSLLNSKVTEASPIHSDHCSLEDISSTLDEKISMEGQYYVKTIKRYAAFPVSSGNIVIESPVIIAVTPYGQIQRKGDPIQLVSIPMDKKGLIYYVGTLNIRAELITNKTSIGGQIELVFTMKGDGNLKLLADPYSGIHVNNLNLSAPSSELKMTDFLYGKAEYEQKIHYYISADKPGDYSLNSIKINYFGNERNTRSVVIPEMKFGFYKKAGSDSKNESTTLKVIDKPGFYHYLFFNPVFFIFFILFCIMPVAGYFYGQHIQLMETNEIYARRFHAGSKLNRQLITARKLLGKKKYKDFYLELQKGVLYFTANKLSLPSGLSGKEILSQMKKAGLSMDLIQTLKYIYDSCSFSGYSGQTEMSSAENVLQSAQAYTENLNKIKIK